MDLPIEQIGKSQWLAAQLKIEPDAKVMQANFGHQTSLKASGIMGPLPSQAERAERVEQFVVDRRDDLAQTSQPATPLLGPGLLAALILNCSRAGKLGKAPRRCRGA